MFPSYITYISWKEKKLNELCKKFVINLIESQKFWLVSLTAHHKHGMQRSDARTLRI